MDEKIRYERVFLIFEQDDLEYSTVKKPSGYIKMEIKDTVGKIQANIKDLPEKSEQCEYGLYILKNINDKLMYKYIGRIPIKNGNGEITWKFQARRKEAGSFSPETLSMAAVIEDNIFKTKGHIVSPLVTYRDKKFDWKKMLKAQMRLEKAFEINAIPNEKPINKLDQKPVEKQNEKLDGLLNEKLKNIPDKKEGNIFNIPEIISGEKSDVYSKFDGDIISKYTTELPKDNEAAEQEEKKTTTKLLETENILIHNLENNNLDNQDNQSTYDDIQQNNEISYEEKPTENVEDNKKDNNLYFDELKKLLGKLDSDNSIADNNVSNNNVQNNDKKGNDARDNANSVKDNIGLKSNTNTKKLTLIQSISRYFDNYMEIFDPFGLKRRDYKWWKVNNPVHLNNILYHHSIKGDVLFNPKVLIAHFKYKHLIVGTYTDDSRKIEYLVFGVPGAYGVDERPFGYYCKWAQVDNNRTRYGSFGYWIVYLNGKTGKLLDV